MGLIWTLPILSFNLLDWRDANTFVLADVSTYTVIPASGSYTLQITPPGYNTINPPFSPGGVNVYKSVDLGITATDAGCVPLPDGIYNIQYTVVPPPAANLPQTTVAFKFIKIDTIKCKYQHAFLQVDLDCHSTNYKAYMQELLRIKVYIDGSVAECNNSNYRLSWEYYQKANKMLDKMKCKFPKNSKFNTCNC